MRGLLRSAMLLTIVGLAGCAGGDEVVTDPSKLKPATPEGIKASQEYDAKVAEEEGGQAFGAKSSAKAGSPKR
jgi:hypothetical protein